MDGRVTWGAGAFELDLTDEDGDDISARWESSDPFGGSPSDLTETEAVRGYAQLAAEIYFSPDMFDDDQARQRYLG